MATTLRRKAKARARQRLADSNPVVWARKEAAQQTAVTAPPHWRDWLTTLFAKTFTAPFADRHVMLWEWLESIEPDTKPSPAAYVDVEPRGGGKTTTAETAVIRLGAKETRKFVLYVRGTQAKANESIQSIATKLESREVERHYPSLSQRSVGKYGQSKGWRMDMLRTANDFNVLALGLDAASRGVKIDDYRPDLIIFDDIDDEHDSEKTLQKKVDVITKSIIPAGAIHCAYLVVQNLIHADGIVNSLVKGAADFLRDRFVSGPHPAIENLKYKIKPEGGYTIIKGTATWAGQSLETCEQQMNDWGVNSFLREAQHEVDGDDPNALMTQEDFDRTRVTAVPDLVRIAVAVDPPGGATECGIVAGGKTRIDKRLPNGKTIQEWHGYTLEDATMPPGCKPQEWGLAVIQCCYRVGADVVFVERNYGGDMVKSTIEQITWYDDNGNVILDGRTLKIEEVNATRGKRVRAEPVATVFQQGRGHHVGVFDKLEKEWRQWVPGDDSPNRLDAEVWLFTGLGLLPTTERRPRSVSMAYTGIR